MAGDSLQEILNDKLIDRVLVRIALGGAITPGLSTLRAVYSAWCARVPFDNVRKMIALGEGSAGQHPAGPLPGCAAEEFFDAWLAHGTGATCWPASNALYVLLRTLGFDARRVAGNMRDLGKTTHASVIATVEGAEWLVDASLQTFQPVPLTPQTYMSRDPVYPAECEPVEDGWVLWWLVPPGQEFIPCRIFPQERPPQFYLDSYERSRGFGPFNQKLYARRSRPDEIVVLFGNTRFRKTAAGVESRELDREQLCAALRDDIGISTELVERWRESGGLESTFQPVDGMKPFSHPSQKLPPSRRH
jgi:N-hydroxyarylamine O-acetyltransferase